MNNSSRSISANEINKFMYCPYQWYYERLYGAIHIRALYKERNQRLGLKDTALSNFKKGQAHHASYGSGGSGRGLRVLKWIAAAVAIIAGFICGYLFYSYFL